MVSNKILRKIKSKKRGWVFCAKDFKGLGSRNAVYKALSAMAGNNNGTDRDAKIIRLIRGIYYYPIAQEGIGIIPPDLSIVVNAIARNAGIKIYPSGALSANILGLSNQAPAQNVYWTHGKSMTKHFGKNAIHFKHVKINPAPKNIGEIFKKRTLNGKKWCPVFGGHNTLQMVFSNHINTGLVLNIKKIRADLENIRKLRNRIFHHEPIVNITLGVEVLHSLIYFYLESMAPEIVEDIREVDNFTTT